MCPPSTVSGVLIRYRRLLIQNVKTELYIRKRLVFGSTDNCVITSHLDNYSEVPKIDNNDDSGEYRDWVYNNNFLLNFSF